MNLQSPPPPPLPRRARTSDVSSLVALENEIFKYDQLKATSFRRFISSQDLWVMENDGNVLAYILILKRKHSKKLRIYSLAVSAEARGQGYGKKLIEHALTQYQGYELIKLEVKVDNLGAIKLYETFGFEQVGRIEGFYSDGTDAYVYQKLL
ncbi:MAG TPA: N-acetyltransferase [Bacteriovoracaceae bacterium]|nr:N-acetyltransferase [Bacteriovoracaceae bacterium]